MKRTETAVILTLLATPGLGCVDQPIDAGGVATEAEPQQAATAASTNLCGQTAEGGTVTLTCPAGQVITSVPFASYGTPTGSCGAFQIGSCNAGRSSTVATFGCYGKASCQVRASNTVFGDPCKGTGKRLYVQATCGVPASTAADAGASRDATRPIDGGVETAPPSSGDGEPPAGNPDGHCAVPAEAQAEDSSQPATVVGTGTPQSCTADAFVNAVAKGGVITFNCGPAPTTITLDRTAKVFNDASKVVIDGGGKVTLSGGGKVRILYQDTCDPAQKWTTSHCDNQETPQLTVQNLTFAGGNSTGETFDGGGGGAIFARGGRLKVVNSRFFDNTCDSVGPDVGGAAIRTLSQYQGLPAYVVNSTFGGRAGLGNVCSNGGGLSSIDVSYSVYNSLFSDNQAIGNGANPAQAGTPGGGSGGAIYNDGNTYTLSLCGTQITGNTANEGGGAIFFVSNDLTGTLQITDSTLMTNPSRTFETPGFPGIFVLAQAPPVVSNSTIK